MVLLTTPIGSSSQSKSAKWWPHETPGGDVVIRLMLQNCRVRYDPADQWWYVLHPTQDVILAHATSFEEAQRLANWFYMSTLAVNAGSLP